MCSIVIYDNLLNKSANFTFTRKYGFFISFGNAVKMVRPYSLLMESSNSGKQRFNASNVWRQVVAESSFKPYTFDRNRCKLKTLETGVVLYKTYKLTFKSNFIASSNNIFLRPC